MADKPSGYRLEYASSARAKCKGPKPCAGTPIGKGELRLGSIVEFRGNTSFAWRHWGCTTPKILENMKKSLEESSELDGYDVLRDEDKKKVDTAWEAGHVADEDIPDSARKPVGDDAAESDEDKPKKKAAAKKAPAKKVAASDDEGATEKPKKARVTKKKADGDEGDEGEKPKKAAAKKPRAKKADDDGEEAAPKKRAPKKTTEAKEKAPPKKRAPKKKKDEEDDESGEDFTEAIDAVPDQQGDDSGIEDEPKPKKKAAPKKPVEKKEKAKQAPKKPVSKKDADGDEEMASGEEPAGESEDSGKKRKRPVSKAGPSKPASKKAKPAPKAKKTKEVVEDDGSDED